MKFKTDSGSAIGRCMLPAVRLWRRGLETVFDHIVGTLRRRLGIRELESAVATWSMSAWIEQARIEHAPLISVIIPTYNRSALLADAVQSVCDQLYSNWEIVVVDDASEDGTPAAIEQLRRRIAPERFRAARIPHGGVCAARNHALALARGDLITYLDDDNKMHRLWLKAVAWGFSQRPETDVIYGGIVIDDMWRLNRKSAGDLPSYHLNPFDHNVLRCHNLADIGAIAHRKDLPEARFDESLREMGDWDLLARLTREKAPLVLPVIACFYSTALADRLSGGPTFEADAARVRQKNQS